MYTLTKTEFWDALQSKYPAAHAHFQKWLNEYQKHHLVFNSNETQMDFEELPDEMQLGVFLSFTMQCNDFQKGALIFMTSGHSNATMKQTIHLFIESMVSQLNSALNTANN